MGSLVETDWLEANLTNHKVRLIEVNWDGLSDYRAGHIPGAIGWNWKQALWDPHERQFPSDADFSARLGEAGIQSNTTVVLYGVPVQFGTYAWWVLKLLGHGDVRLLNGGKVKWSNEGRALTTDEPKHSPTSYIVSRRNELSRAGRDDVMAALNHDDVIILDHRSHEEFSGQRVGLPGKPDVGAERYGRIPGAQYIPFDSLINSDTTFKSPAELKALIDPHVPGPEASVISYCRLAHRATLASFAMTELLGFTNVRVYDGSWTEWGSMVGVPIER